MSCCGKKRRLLQTELVRFSHPATPSSTRIQQPKELVFSGDSPVLLRGQETGLVYVFSPRDRHVTVDEKDLHQLIATGWFEQDRSV